MSFRRSPPNRRTTEKSSEAYKIIYARFTRWISHYVRNDNGGIRNDNQPALGIKSYIIFGLLYGLAISVKLNSADRWEYC